MENVFIRHAHYQFLCLIVKAIARGAPVMNIYGQLNNIKFCQVRKQIQQLLSKLLFIEIFFSTKVRNKSKKQLSEKKVPYLKKVLESTTYQSHRYRKVSKKKSTSEQKSTNEQKSTKVSHHHRKVLEKKKYLKRKKVPRNKKVPIFKSTKFSKSTKMHKNTTIDQLTQKISNFKNYQNLKKYPETKIYQNFKKYQIIKEFPGKQQKL